MAKNRMNLAALGQLASKCGACGKVRVLLPSTKGLFSRSPEGLCVNCLAANITSTMKTLKELTWPVSKFLVERKMGVVGEALPLGQDLYLKLVEAAKPPEPQT